VIFPMLILVPTCHFLNSLMQISNQQIKNLYLK
jgi:hypothetical protein